VVLRIDSPGGSAVGVRTLSGANWSSLADSKPERPLVVSMSDLAASGGYYIAVARADDRRRARHAHRNPIGIFGGKIVHRRRGSASWAANIDSVSNGRTRR